MSAATKENREVTLPEGVSLGRVGQVMLEAWEADPRRWMNAPLELREDASQPTVMPVTQDALDLFRLLAERRVEYLLVGGMAMLTYVKGRNTKKVDLLLSLEASHVPAATVEGLIVLKLYALPSLYRQFDMDRAALYENDITILIAQYSPQLDPLFALATREMEPGDKAELNKIIVECRERAKLLRQRTGR